MNKKADISAEEMVFYFLVFLPILVIVFTGLIYVIAFHGSEKTKIPKDIEDDIIAKRFTDVCFKADEYGIGVIDFDKFNEKHLNDCYDDRKAPVRLSITSLNLDAKKIESPYWGESGRFFTKKVLIEKDDRIHEGDLKIEINS